MPSNKDYKTHESYGMASLSRQSGGSKRLFGSAVKNHSQTVSLRIYHGEFAHDLHQDWYSTVGLRPIIEIEFSPAQFAEFITTMNVGSGIPCTIRSIEGKDLSGPPADENEVERVQTGFAKEMRLFAKSLEKDQADVEALLAKPTITKADRKTISDKIAMVKQHIASNMPFALSQFQEATEKVVTSAKAETEAFMMHAVTKAGLESLQSGQYVEAMKGLPEPPKPGEIIKAGKALPERREGGLTNANLAGKFEED